MKILIVGCGLSGSTIARLAAEDNHQVCLIDKREHIGGNVYDFIDEDTGIRLSKYGVHIFHTNNDEVWNFVNRFSEWNPYQHKVLSYLNGRYVPIPVNINTINEVFNVELSKQEQAQSFLSKLQYKGKVTNSEDAAKARVGDRLYELLFLHYTIKQWDKHPRELEPSVLERIPVRTDFNDRYFNDKYEALPANGYTSFVTNMLNHENIKVLLNTEYSADFRKEFDVVFFTGKIDSYFQEKYGKLEYRSLDFKYELLNMKQYQPYCQVNYPEERHKFTRIIEYKHLYPIDINKTIIAREYSTSEGEEYYPVPTEKNRAIYNQYQKEAETTEDKEGVYFVGRLANYKYMNMDEAISNAIIAYKKFTSVNK
jgi:UDP-galactopyranose mutase